MSSSNTHPIYYQRNNMNLKKANFLVSFIVYSAITRRVCRRENVSVWHELEYYVTFCWCVQVWYYLWRGSKKPSSCRASFGYHQVNMMMSGSVIALFCNSHVIVACKSVTLAWVGMADAWNTVSVCCHVWPTRDDIP